MVKYKIHWIDQREYNEYSTLEQLISYCKSRLFEIFQDGNIDKQYKKYKLNKVDDIIDLESCRQAMKLFAKIFSMHGMCRIRITTIKTGE